MYTPKYGVTQQPISVMMGWIESKTILIPEIQRPFVWSPSKVRDLMDSLYRGFPVGYIITWLNPSIKGKDGATALGKQIIIDGQQRLTALTAALAGKPVLNDSYKRVRIKIAFHPMEEKFETLNPAIERNSLWINDISEVMAPGFNALEFLENYCLKNPDLDRNVVFQRINGVQQIAQRPIGIIELAPDLDIQTVTEIFIRINSQGVTLSQADFAMSKIAASEEYGGPMLRKCVDYFARLAAAPEFLPHLQENDGDFVGSEYFQRIKWMGKENDDLYDPDYADVLRVAFWSEFGRGRLVDLVSLLSGRNFETRSYESAIAEASFAKLKEGVYNVVNEHQYKSLLHILTQAGFVSRSLIRSQNAVNMCYAIYLILRKRGLANADIQYIVRRWFVMSLLTSRYGGSTETQVDYDITRLEAASSPREWLREVEAAELSDVFWDVSVVQNLDTASVNSPVFSVYLAAQVAMKARGFLSSHSHAHDLVRIGSDKHHLFPKDRLKKAGHGRGDYNQVANLVIADTTINIQIGNKEPADYMKIVRAEIEKPDEREITTLHSESDLKSNLEEHDIPASFVEMRTSDYQDFLVARRALMAQRLKKYYREVL
ncbi:MAG: DUF262 domain-containing protein [Ignavibacteria bacterium]|nr:DUF262 domain-containing protein [Ignavibacteria bacterium]MBK6420282.1 DUF262 domain-containing protein [Ignavibacteria bacterium]MBK7412766.1 DUF262 domain-containing protein [Ignavibacteria bacterium]